MKPENVAQILNSLANEFDAYNHHLSVPNNKRKKYNAAATLAFSLELDNNEAEGLGGEVIYAAILRRLALLLESPDPMDQVWEATMSDLYDIQEN